MDKIMSKSKLYYKYLSIDLSELETFNDLDEYYRTKLNKHILIQYLLHDVTKVEKIEINGQNVPSLENELNTEIEKLKSLENELKAAEIEKLQLEEIDKKISRLNNDLNYRLAFRPTLKSLLEENIISESVAGFTVVKSRKVEIDLEEGFINDEIERLISLANDRSRAYLELVSERYGEKCLKHYQKTKRFQEYLIDEVEDDRRDKFSEFCEKLQIIKSCFSFVHSQLGSLNAEELKLDYFDRITRRSNQQKQTKYKLKLDELAKFILETEHSETKWTANAKAALCKIIYSIEPNEHNRSRVLEIQKSIWARIGFDGFQQRMEGLNSEKLTKTLIDQIKGQLHKIDDESLRKEIQEIIKDPEKWGNVNNLASVST